MQELEPRVVEVAYPGDVYSAREAAKALAISLGFDDVACEEIDLVVGELGSNLLKHAGRGTLTLSPVGEQVRRGIQVESADRGPGIADVEQAIADGYSTTGSLGFGLGTVNRLMDELSITSPTGPERGTRIVCTRWLRLFDPSARSCPFDVGVASRPYPGMSVNGDSFAVKLWNHHLLVAVIDGLGHGQFAHRAAQAAREYVERHFDQPFAGMFRGTARACRATRGVVMAVARFDCAQGTMALAGIGNVQVRVLDGAEPGKLLMRRGVLGARAPLPLVTERAWLPGAAFVLHTDGVSSHWGSDDLVGDSAAAVAQSLLRAHAYEHDDATVLIVKDAAR